MWVPVVIWPVDDLIFKSLSPVVTRFTADTYASKHGIGAVLSQVKDGVEHPVAYASRMLNKGEELLSVCDAERTACRIGISEEFPSEQKLLIWTDHAPLRTLLKVQEPEGQLARPMEFRTEKLPQ